MINDNISNMKQKVNTQVLIKNFGAILVLLLSFWAVKPLFAPGFFPMHDDTQVARVFEMGKALKDGMFPVRWVEDLGYGYGYPIFNFYAPLAYYFGGLLTLFGFDALVATKTMFVLGILLSGIFMYLLAREFWGEIGGIVSGLFYVYAPYHAVDIYVRGDVAEVWAYGFIPLVFYGLYKIYNDYKLRWKWVAVSSFGYAAIILSHNLTAMMATPIVAIAALLYCYIAYKKKNLSSIFYILYSIFLGLMLSAFYWIPALVEMKYTNVLSQIGAGADFRDHFVCLSQLWESSWGFGGSIPGCIDGLSFKIGKLHLIMVFLSFLTLVVLKRFWAVVLSIVGFIVSVFLTLEISKPIWEAIPLIAFFQYPWRFLILASFFSSLLAGFVVWFLSASTFTSKESRLRLPRYLRGVSLGSLKYAGFVVVIFLLINFNFKLFQPQTILSKTSRDYTNEKALKWTASKISDEFLPPDFKKPKSEYEVAKKPLPFKETSIEKTSNLVSLIGALALIIGIILFS